MSNKNQLPRTVWIVSGPSGSGKTSLCDAFLQDDFWSKRLMKSVSYTTRPMRPGEKEGKDYIHMTPQKFLSLKRAGVFLEREKIFGFDYGTPKKVLEDARRADKDLLLCIDVKGAKRVKKFFKKNAVSIFILPPQLKALRGRLKKRLTESEKDIEKRLRRVKTELSYIKDYDYVVVNDDFNVALKKLKSILTAKHCEGAYVLRSIGKTYR